MSLLPQQLARQDGASIEVRDEPLRLSWTFDDDLVSSDSHTLRVRFVCSVKVADTAADRKIFQEVFLGSRQLVMADDVVAHFNAPLRKAASTTAAAHTAEAWTGERAHEMQSALVSAGQAVAFACGLELLAPFHVEIESPTLQRHRLEAIERARAEERVAGQVQHFQRAGELLKQFQALREQMPQLTPGQLLEHINPTDRGSTLQSLLMAAAQQRREQMLWAVAGPHLVRIDASDLPPQMQLTSLPTALGPLRSVQPATINGRHLLLVGARLGVLVVPPDSPAEAQLYFDPTVQSQLGFNRAIAAGGEIWASHGEAGVVGWKIGQTEQPFARFSANPDSTSDSEALAPPPLPPAAVVSMGASPSLIATPGSRSARPQGPRNLQMLDESHLVWSVGNDLIILPREQLDRELHALPTESTAEIVAILPADERSMLVIHADSTIALLSRQTHQVIDRQRRAGRVCAAGALPWLDSVRMLLVDSDGAIDCVAFDDPLITQYAGQHRGLRAISASPQFVAAIASDRQRVILWQSWEGRAPVAEVHVTGVARHRVADVEFG